MISRRSYASRSETNFQNSPFLQHPVREGRAPRSGGGGLHSKNASAPAGLERRAREFPRCLHPHPRVTAVARRRQPPRRLPSPATERARDLRKGLRQRQPINLTHCERRLTTCRFAFTFHPVGYRVGDATCETRRTGCARICITEDSIMAARLPYMTHNDLAEGDRAIWDSFVKERGQPGH